MYTCANRIIGSLGQINYKNAIWILAASETLHNLEEALWLPGWSKTAGLLHPPVGAFEFRFAVTILTLIFYGIIYYYSKYESNTSKSLFSGLLVLVFFNIFIPHVAGTIFTGHYVPGAASGLLLNAPVTLYLIRRGIREGFFNARILIRSGIFITAACLPLLPLLFALGRALDRTI